MRLNGAQMREVRRALLDAYATRAELQLLLLDRLDKQLDHLALGNDLTEIAMNLVARANHESWIDALLDAAVQDRPNDGQLRELAAALPRGAGTNAGDDDFSVIFFRNRPLVDRDHLRDALRKLDESDGKRILIVGGESGSGKSYTAEVIEYLKAVRQFEVAHIDLLKFTAVQLEIDPYQLGKLIALEMGLEPPEAQGYEADARWIFWFSSWLKGKLRKENRTWWLVIDSFDRCNVRQSALDLVRDLAALADMGVPNLRLVLISYGDTLPPSVERSIEREAIEQIGDAHLADFFIRYIAARAPERTPDELIAEIAADAIDRVTMEMKKHTHAPMQAMNDAVVAECDRIARLQWPL